MKRTLVIVLLGLSSASSAFASDLEVPLGSRSLLKSKKAIHEIVVRDPSMLSVVVTDGAVSLEGKKSGMTAVTVEFEDGELERSLVVVGDGIPTTGMSAEQPRKIDLKQSAKAEAKALTPKKAALVKF